MSSDGEAGQTRGSSSKEEPPPAPEPLAVAVADSHCHLDIMGGDIQAQLDLARSVGIDTVVQVGVDLESSRLSAELAERYDDVWAAVALHPNEAGRGAATPEALQEIRRLAELPQVKAIGETGLDHYRTGPDGQGIQEESFRAHIAIAKETGKALVIHDRDAHDDVLRVLREEGAPEVTVFHCYSGDAAMARVCADAGWYLSFAGPVTFKPNDELRAAAAVCPQDRLLVETDAPFLTPMPFRGRPNAPYLIPLTMRALAAARAADLDELCRAVADNTRRAFSL
ncbi:MAG: tatD [Frankiales bacterium]|nr:tatD [Frankiales bacterium]